ncbi:MAG: helix-turn-helix domain-containing protein, partial [Bacteroidetes bacterium]|nr:helix-turn-helix domain-containing protein [Bacteroidota bacterium]
MISRKELLSSKEYWLTKINCDLFEQVNNYLSKNKISKTEFAKTLGVSKGYVSQILNGDFDHKTSKLIELCLAIGKVPVLNFENLVDFLGEDSREDHRRATGQQLRYLISSTEFLIPATQNLQRNTKSRLRRK